MIGNGPAGTDLTDEFRTLSATASFNQWAGFDVVRVVPGECDLRLVWRGDDMGQYAGFLHAGLIAALLDTACGFAAAALVGSVLSSHFSVNCLAPAVGDEFLALGRVVKAGRKQVFTSGELHARRDGTSKLVATASAILVPSGVAIELDAPTAKAGNAS
jgi:uncharacterized protein (TIGR00369 family)